jgi:hypothetical protein
LALARVEDLRRRPCVLGAAGERRHLIRAGHLFLLLWIAIAAALFERGRRFAAGMVLALCSAKPHLFLLLPLLLLGRRMWSTIWGLLAGGALLAAVSFAAAGPHWPREFLSGARPARQPPSVVDA